MKNHENPPETINNQPESLPNFPKAPLANEEDLEEVEKYETEVTKEKIEGKNGRKKKVQKQRGKVMMRHNRSVHEDLKYQCNDCDYQATIKSNLKNHIDAMHSNNILTCYQCDFKTKWRGAFNSHIKKHRSYQD